VGTLVNRTGHAVGHAIGHDPQGFWQVTIAVKATFTWDKDRRAVPAPPLPIVEQPNAGGPDGRPAPPVVELGPPKPRVDVLLAGALAFPVPIEQIDVSLAVGARVRKVVRVFGDRHWLPGMVEALAPGRPVPTTSVPISWERSFGGSDPEDLTYSEPRNPVGTGVARHPQSVARRLAPNFEDPSAPISSWKSRPAPAGFGPLAAHWPQRARFAGTYDDRWKKTGWPLPPLDFDPAFFNVAPADQQLDDYLPGEEVALTYMTSAGHDHFLLPIFEVPVTVVTVEDLIEDVATVDTIIIEPAERRFSLVAHAAARLHPGAASLRQIIVGERSRPASATDPKAPAETRS
jgi:hypothetical protein